MTAETETPKLVRLSDFDVYALPKSADKPPDASSFASWAAGIIVSEWLKEHDDPPFADYGIG